jgi:hypothetical protein
VDLVRTTAVKGFLGMFCPVFEWPLESREEGLGHLMVEASSQQTSILGIIVGTALRFPHPELLFTPQFLGINISHPERNPYFVCPPGTDLLPTMEDDAPHEPPNIVLTVE